MKLQDIVLVYNKKKNSWKILKFSDFKKFEEFLLDLKKRKGNEFTEPMVAMGLPVNKKKFLVLRKHIRLAYIRIPRLACILNKKKKIYYFFKRVGSRKLEEFIKKLREISKKEINEKLKKETKFKLSKNLSQVAEFLSYITSIPKERIRKEMKIFLEEDKKEIPEIVKKFISEIKKIPHAIPPPIEEEKCFNEWGVERKNWLNKIKKRIKKGDKKAKEELIKATFVLGVAEANKKYGNIPIIFLNLVRLAYLDLLKTAKKFDWQKADVEHFYFDVGFTIRGNLVTMIDRYFFKVSIRKFPYDLAIEAILRMPEERREIIETIRANKTKNKSS